MGCFLSTSSAAPPPKTPRIPNSAASAQHNGGSKSPPPVDEETVKEVLSETPAIPKRPPPPVPRFHGSERMLHQNGGAAKKLAPSYGNEDPSDVDSEIHTTHSDNFSTENDDGALRWPRLNYRPFPGEVKREKTAGRSPARRSDTSPGRVKPGSGYSRKTGGGESLGRRSRSPVIRSDSGSSKTGLDAGKSSRKTGNHPGRVGFGSGEREEPPTSNELLESSLVSLECFIFL